MKKAKKVKNVVEHAEEAKRILEDIMAQTLRNCKSSDMEISWQSTRINALAHRCSVSIDRLVSEYRGEK